MILLMGVAGAGKSLQGKILADELGYPWISTGEVLRVLVTGKRRQEMLEGKLLSDEEVIKVVDKVLDLIDTNQDFVLDCFPRTIKQAKWLVQQAGSGRLHFKAVFNFKAPKEVVQKRLLKRGRHDDTDQAITERFREYKTQTVPIIDYFKTANLPVHEVKADQQPRLVHEQIMGFINKS